MMTTLQQPKIRSSLCATACKSVQRKLHLKVLAHTLSGKPAAVSLGQGYACNAYGAVPVTYNHAMQNLCSIQATYQASLRLCPQAKLAIKLCSITSAGLIEHNIVSQWWIITALTLSELTSTSKQSMDCIANLSQNQYLPCVYCAGYRRPCFAGDNVCWL